MQWCDNVWQEDCVKCMTLARRETPLRIHGMTPSFTAYISTVSPMFHAHLTSINALSFVKKFPEFMIKVKHDTLSLFY